jgi:hypothetical protein
MIYCDFAFDCDGETEEQCSLCGRNVCRAHSANRFDPTYGYLICVCHFCEVPAGLPAFNLGAWLKGRFRKEAA